MERFDFKYFNISRQKREEIIKKIKKILKGRKEVVFAYIFGSFIEDFNMPFRDIDLGIFINSKEISQADDLTYKFDLQKLLFQLINYPVDVVILNNTDFKFLNHVFSRGKILISRDDVALTNIIERVNLKYFQYIPFQEQNLREIAI